MAVITTDVTTSPKRILVKNNKRVMYAVLNDSGYNVYIGHDKNVSTTGKTKGILVSANGGVWSDEFYKGEVWAIATGDAEVTVVEVTEEEG